MKQSTRRATEVGAGVVTAAMLAAAAAYWISEKTTKEQRAKAKRWVLAARKEVARHATKARAFGEKEYKRIVDAAVRKHGSLEDVSLRDITKAASDLKAEWKRIQAHAKQTAGKSGRSAKRSAKRSKPRRSARRRKTSR